jgi:signal transduction histidine kinase
VVHESDAEELKQQIKQANRTPGGVSVTYRVKNLKTGRVAYILEHRQAVVTNSNLVLGYEGVWLDITRQTIAEKRLSTAAWKETLAVLTMGLAHDFSNVMAGIHSLSESFLAQVDSLHPFHEGLTLIKQNSLQASQLVQRIINLHHGKTGERNYCNLNEIITDLVELGRKIIPRRIEVKVELSNEPLHLYLDFVEFRQVIINLVLNAADAMPQRGELLFRTSLHQDLPALDHFQGQLPRLPSVCLTVKDNGCGIEARHIASIFDPFFTTKPMEKGSGLGLYNARLFIEKHHGAISVDSIEGAGTTFRIWLPLSDFTEGEREAEISAGVRRSLLLAGSAGKSIETIAEFLRLNGYQAVLAHSEDQAFEILGSNKYRFAGLMILLETNHAEFISLLKNPQLQEQSLKVILRIVGCNQDELDIEHLRRADLIIPPESSQENILRELERLFK